MQQKEPSKKAGGGGCDDTESFQMKEVSDWEDRAEHCSSLHKSY